MTKNKEKAIPKWFKGEVYTEGDTVTNKFSGSSYDYSTISLTCLKQYWDKNSFMV